MRPGINDRKILVTVISVPNDEMIYKEAMTFNKAEREKAVDEVIQRRKDQLMAMNNNMLPLMYKKIVGLSMVWQDANETKRCATFSGKEPQLLNEFWKIFNNGISGKSFPVLISADGKQSAKLLQTRTHRILADVNKQGLTHVPRDLSKEEFYNLKHGLTYFENDRDKWEQNGPNYTNAYSNYSKDLSYEVQYKNPGDLIENMAERYIEAGQIKSIAIMALKIGLDSWFQYKNTEERIPEIKSEVQDTDLPSYYKGAILKVFGEDDPRETEITRSKNEPEKELER